MIRRLLFISLLITFTVACDSKTIYNKPKDLIPKDSMSLLFKELLIANAASNIKNIRLQKKISYQPLVYKKFKIDSARFHRSNVYYTSTIDDYEDIFARVISDIEKELKSYVELKKRKDSIYRDSIIKKKEQINKSKNKKVDFDIKGFNTKKKKGT